MQSPPSLSCDVLCGTPHDAYHRTGAVQGGRSPPPQTTPKAHAGVVGILSNGVHIALAFPLGTVHGLRRPQICSGEQSPAVAIACWILHFVLSRNCCRAHHLHGEMMQPNEQFLRRMPRHLPQSFFFQPL
ncbi:hypothetical protein OPV22_020683 [Ensete ventricosum]|uniref:Uncharacterized protein n=1 Tax=Ensete ventricosum TaxID=4639 RepID=A0AAV8PC80_ENSVE|nr:hypothetical protein OPV22_020683 [Ensete ventricosum]